MYSSPQASSATTLVRGQRSLVWAFSALIVTACQPEPVSPAGRQIVTVTWDTLWQTQPGFMETNLTEPSLMTFNQGKLLIVDGATPAVVALDPSSGRLLWKVGRAGAGPAEFAGVSSVVPNREGGIDVVDIVNRRFSHIDAAGTVTGTTSIARAGAQPDQLCSLEDGRRIVADPFRPEMAVLNSAGNVMARLPLPWPDLASARAESRQVILQSDASGGRCVVALTTGRGFAILLGQGDPVLRTYIEPLDVFGVGARKDEPEVTTTATFEVDFVGDTLLVLFGGATTDQNRLVDRYSASTGRYIDSYRLPFKAYRLAAHGGTLFVRGTSGLSIVAIRPRR